ncbi:MAG: hypothetical protein JWO22_4097 [Frankiales bacterium]|nr:hypothetical protein [Frankiales bacterium]
MTWELSQLVHRYALWVDEGGPVASLFTEDGVLVSPDPPGSLLPVVEHVGRDAISAAMTGLPKTFHAVVGEVYEGASGRIACVAHHAIAPDRDLVWHLRYADSYEQDEDRWLIARRELTIELVEVRPLKQVRL